MNVQMLGLCGLAGSGKDSVADVLVRCHGLARVAFADTVKEVALAIDPVVTWNAQEEPSAIRLATVVDAHGWDEAKGIPEVRRLLQVIGTEAGRDILGADVWVDAAFRNKVYPLLDIARGGASASVSGVVLTDVRFRNELARVRDHLGFVVYIRRPGLKAVNDHASEQLAQDMEAWDGVDHHALFDRVILNDGTLADLEGKVDALMRQLAAERGNA